MINIKKVIVLRSKFNQQKTLQALSGVVPYGETASGTKQGRILKTVTEKRQKKNEIEQQIFRDDLQRIEK
ncbi:hypothetical protein J4410_05080 [Candidatus Woesearchaeota archaeon]|nr:hypothetical protein [Candidatus Woesearchaeota archaeon]